MKKWFLSLSKGKRALAYLVAILLFVITGSLINDLEVYGLVDYILAFVGYPSFIMIFVFIYWDYIEKKDKKKQQEQELEKQRRKEILEKIYRENIQLTIGISQPRKKGISDYLGKSVKQFVDDYVVVDVETTGFTPGMDEIIEIAMIKVKNNEIIDKFHSFVKPCGSIPKSITNINRITNEMVEGYDDYESIFTNVRIFLDDCVILGHNASFDIRFIKTYMNDYIGHEMKNDYICTLNLSRKYIKNTDNHKLDTLAEHLNISKPRHRSLADCLATHELYQYLKTNYGR